MRRKLAWACVAVAVLVLAGDRLITELLPPHAAGDLTFRAVAQVCLLLAVGLSAAVLIARRLTRDLRHLAGVAAQLRRGQLTATARVRGRDEVAELASALNEMAAALRHTALETQSHALEVAETAQGLSLGGRDLDTAGGEIARAARGIARGAERQVEALERTSGITRALAATLREVAGRAVQAHATAGRAHDRAIGGADAAARAAVDLTAIAAAAEHAGGMAESCADSSRQIHGAVDFILDLAQQTQILALNAALEAARAGEEGRGFAALAEEIRALADRTQTFGSRVRDRVRALDAGVAGLLRGMAATASAAQSGRATAETARQTLEDLGRTLAAVEKAIEEIRAQTEAQTEGAQALMTGIEDIARIAGEHASGTEETSAAVGRQHASTRELARSASRLASTARALRERTVMLGSPEPGAPEGTPPVAIEARA